MVPETKVVVPLRNGGMGREEKAGWRLPFGGSQDQGVDKVKQKEDEGGTSEAMTCPVRQISESAFLGAVRVVVMLEEAVQRMVGTAGVKQG